MMNTEDVQNTKDGTAEGPSSHDSAPTTCGAVARPELGPNYQDTDASCNGSMGSEHALHAPGDHPGIDHLPALLLEATLVRVKPEDPSPVAGSGRPRSEPLNSAMRYRGDTSFFVAPKSGCPTPHTKSPET